MTYQLTNLTVVTGASSGIGAEIARRLAARKARLLLTGRDAGGLRAVAGSLDPAAPAAELVTADLADPAGIDTLVAAIGDRPVDLLVNNVGFATHGAHADLDPRAEAGVIAVNCTALVALTRAVLPGMLERRHGFVLNTASTIAFQPAPGQATYGASKAFVLSYSEALAEELRGTGVRAAAICPGPTESGFLGAMGRPEAATSAIYWRHGSAAHVADVAIRMLDGHRVVKVVGLMNAVMAQAGRLAPRPVMRRLADRLLRPRPASITALNEITVDAPAQAVWALLADPQRWPQWYAACRWVHSPAPGPLPAGAAFELAERHGWADEPAVGLASAIAARMLIWQGRLEEAEPWIQGAERTLRAEAEPAGALGIRLTRGLLELARGRDADALAAFQAADRLAGRLAEPSPGVMPNRSFLVQTLARLGETERAEQFLAALADQDRDNGQMRISLAALRLAQDDPPAAAATLAPVLDGSAQVPGPGWLAQAFLLEAIARDALGDPAAGRAVERALDLAEPDCALLWFVLHPAPGLLQRHARHGTAHAALIADILSLLAGNRSAPPPAGPPQPLEPLSDSELRVLRYLPTNLTGPEIAGELYVSSNTVKSHMRSLYAKLGTHHRAETVTLARDLGLLAPSARSAR